MLLEFLENIKNTVNIENIIKKLIVALIVKMTGKHIFGNFIFFIKFAFSIKILTDRLDISANRPHAKIPEHR